MAGSINKVILVGNLGRDPEIRTTQDGREIANLVLATSDTWKDKSTGEKRERTEWHRIVIFNEGLINVTKNYLHKGSKVYIEGSLQTRKWVDNSGAEKYTTEVVIQGFNGNLTILDKANNNNHSQSNNNSESFGSEQPRAKQQASQAAEELDDEIPF